MEPTASSLKKSLLLCALRDKQTHKHIRRKILTPYIVRCIASIARWIIKNKIHYKSAAAILEVQKIRKPLRKIASLSRQSPNFCKTVRDIILTPYFYKKDKSVIPLSVLLTTRKDILCV